LLAAGLDKRDRRSWLIASVCSDFTTQMSSAIVPVCGSNSLSHRPHLPWRLKRNIGATQGNELWPEVMPVMRWPMRIDAGSWVPCSWRSVGL